MEMFYYKVVINYTLINVDDVEYSFRNYYSLRVREVERATVSRSARSL